MSVKVRDTVTADGKRFEQTMEELRRLEVRVGYQQGKKHKKARGKKGTKGKKHTKVKGQKGTKGKGKIDLVDIAMYNELGTARSPSRPFLRNSVDGHEDEISRFMQKAFKEIVAGKSAEEVLKQIGVFQKRLIQKEIREGDFVPNAPKTIQIKGSDRPLIDTGQMRQSVNYVIQEKGESD